MARTTLLSAAALLGTACGEEPAGPPMDGGADTTPMSDGATDSGPLVSPVIPAALPAPACPETWRTVSREDVAPGLVVCEPWPEVETPCAAHEMRLPGDESCRPVGSPCPADGWPADLPNSGVVFVRPGADAPGDGSRASPYPTAGSALAALPAGTTTLALGAGSYDELIELEQPLRLVGACPEQTILSSSISPLIITGAGDVTVEDVRFVADDQARVLSRNTTLTLSRVAFDGVGITAAGGSLSIEDAVFRGGGAGTEYAIAGSAVDVVSAQRILIEDTTMGGMIFSGMDGSRTLIDVYLRRVRRPGIISSGIELEMQRVVVDGAGGTGIHSLGPASASNVFIRGAGGGMPAGFIVGGDLTASALHVEDSGHGLLLAEGAGSLVDATFIGGNDEAIDSRGVEVAEGGSLTAERVLIARSRDLGIYVGTPEAVTFRDLTVRGVSPRAVGGFGRCLHAQDGARLEITRGELTACTEAGLTAAHGAMATLRDVTIGGVRAAPCDDCPAQAGVGLVALEDGAIELTRFVVEDSALAGVMIIPGGELDLHDGTIRGNPVGINVQDESYDLERAMDGVVFADNGLNLDSSALPVPAPTVPEL